MPDLHALTLTEAVTALVQVGLMPGATTEAFDPAVPAGSVIASSPPPAPRWPRGRRSTTSCRRAPSRPRPRRPTPAPTPSPSPTPTPAPTATPLVNVGEYRCVTLAPRPPSSRPTGSRWGRSRRSPPGTQPADDSLVFEQNPLPGKKLASGSPITLGVYDPASYPFPTCPPLRTLTRPGSLSPGLTPVWPRSRPRSGSAGRSPAGRSRYRAWRTAVRRGGRSPARSEHRLGHQRRRGDPAGPDLVAGERAPPAVEAAVADAAEHGVAEVDAGRAAGARAPADPAAGGLGLRGPTVRAAPDRHGRMVAATSRPVEPAG